MKPEKTELELLSEVSGKLDRLIGLVAAQGKDEDSKIRILYGLGFDWPSIGVLVGLSPEAVRKRNARAKKRKKK